MVLCHLLTWDVCYPYLPSTAWLSNHLSPSLPTLLLTESEFAATAGNDFTALLYAALPRFRIDPTSVPVFFQEQVRKRFEEFSFLYREEIQTMFQRARPYLPMIKLILSQQNVPGFFAFIPLAESAFLSMAEHPVSGARGLWQLLPDTARFYGIQVSSANDERVHPARSTLAAARYLRMLHDLFGDDAPLLVLAAYNFGEQNLMKAMGRTRTRDIWTLFHKRQIPYQTRDYLVKMVTFWMLIAHAERFQLSIEPAEPIPVTEASLVHTASLRTGELRARVSPQPQPADNPLPSAPLMPACSLQPQATIAVDRSPYCAGLWPAWLVLCPTLHQTASGCWHTVVAGESLWTIAQRYALDLPTLKALNQLGGANPIIRPGQRLITCTASVSDFKIVPDL
jgi:hypothetical protein